MSARRVSVLLRGPICNSVNGLNCFEYYYFLIVIPTRKQCLRGRIKTRPKQYSHDVWHISGTDKLYIHFHEQSRPLLLVFGGLSGYLETGQAKNRAG